MKVWWVRLSIVALFAVAILTAYSADRVSSPLADADAAPAAAPRACSFAGKGICMEYTGAGYSAPDIAPAMANDCRENGGEILETGCRAPAPVGVCTIDPSTDSETRSRFYAPANTADSGRKLCEESGGVWSAS
jgi:hypothetical protein